MGVVKIKEFNTMNPFKNISIFRDQICNCLPWSSKTDTETNPIPFPERHEYDIGWSERQTELVYKEIELLKQENTRLHHLTNVLIQHIGKTGDRGLPLKEIDRQMKIFDEANECEEEL